VKYLLCLTLAFMSLSANAGLFSTCEHGKVNQKFTIHFSGKAKKEYGTYNGFRYNVHRLNRGSASYTYSVSTNYSDTINVDIGGDAGTAIALVFDKCEFRIVSRCSNEEPYIDGNNCSMSLNSLLHGSWHVDGPFPNGNDHYTIKVK
jgi:hypothetical protein